MSKDPADLTGGEDIPMTDPPSYPRTRDDTGAESGGEAGGRGPRRTVILLWVAGIVLVLLVIALHLAGAVGPGTNG
jgi:hypothetical protein